MPKNRRAAALILALCLLTACSAPAPEPEEPERAESEPLVEYIELGELVDAHYFASDGESCWYISDARNTGCTLWTFDLDTREADSVRFVFTDPETGLVPDTGDICGLCATENGLVVCVSWADSPHEEREFAFCLVGEDGSVEKLRRASELCPGATEFNHLGLNGRLYLYSDGAGITELSADLEPVRSVDPGVQGWCRLDADGGRLLLLQLGLDSWNYPVIENYYAIDPDTLKASPIESAAFRRSEYTLVEYGVDYGNIAGEATLPDGRIAALDSGCYEEPECYLVLVYPERLAQDTRTRLTLGGYDLARFSEPLDSIARFNRENDSARIAVRDYLYGMEVDGSHSPGRARLLRDLAEGEAPDIFMADGLSVRELAARGALTDLSGFIEADPELGDAEYSAYMELLRIGGGMYYLPDYSVFRAVALNRRTAGESLDFDELLAAARAGTLPAGLDRSRVFDDLGGGVDSFIDWESGTCSFESERFIGLLKLALLLPEEYDWETSPEGEPLFQLAESPEFDIYREELGENLVLTGLPGTDGGIWCEPGRCWAVNADCADAAGAWSCIRSCFKMFMPEDTCGAERTYYHLDPACPAAELITGTLEGFYSGELTAEETARLVQQRVEEYLNEQS